MTSLTALNLKIPEMLRNIGRVLGSGISFSEVKTVGTLTGLQGSWALVQMLTKKK